MGKCYNPANEELMYFACHARSRTKPKRGTFGFRAYVLPLDWNRNRAIYFFLRGAGVVFDAGLTTATGSSSSNHSLPVTFEYWSRSVPPCS